MIAGLSDLLRRTLDLGAAADITLAEEIDLVTRYVEIQRARFGDRLQVRIAMDDRVAGARVPALLLQPLVENAITHGLAARLDAGRIDIDAALDGADVVIDVTDDGNGVAETEGKPERIGLGNTRARLQAAYGDRARLDLAPAPGRGTRVRVVIPR
jgi:LytS/YehU family sensor histidine kinase